MIKFLFPSAGIFKYIASNLFFSILLNTTAFSQFAELRSEFALRLHLSDVNSGYSDETVVYFENGSTNEFDERYDALKFLSPEKEVPSIFTVSGDKQMLSINGLPDVGQNRLIPVFLKTNSESEYKLTIQGLPSFPGEYNIGIILPEENCYLEWSDNTVLHFYMPKNNAFRAAFFVLISGEDHIGLKHPCKIGGTITLKTSGK